MTDRPTKKDDVEIFLCLLHNRGINAFATVVGECTKDICETHNGAEEGPLCHGGVQSLWCCFTTSFIHRGSDLGTEGEVRHGGEQDEFDQDKSAISALCLVGSGELAVVVIRGVVCHNKKLLYEALHNDQTHADLQQEQLRHTVDVLTLVINVLVFCVP